MHFIQRRGAIILHFNTATEMSQNKFAGIYIAMAGESLQFIYMCVYIYILQLWVTLRLL